MSTYTPIASLTLSSAQSSVTFDAIPQTYTDLVLVTSVKYTSSEQALALTFNNDSGTNYNATYLYGNGSSATSGRDTNNILIPIARGDANNFWAGTTNISNYRNTTTFKSVLSRGNSGTYVISYTGLWRNTSAITSLKIAQLTGSSFASGSTFNLYGIANAAIANTPKATGGNIIDTDGTYWYHTFTSSGTFTPTVNLSNVDYLVVAGGGSSAANGGGGAGGLRCTVGATGGGGSLESKISLTSATAYTITVGGGGGLSDGSNSSISGSGLTTITSIGGGRGGNNNGGFAGGSGGGGVSSSTLSKRTGGAGTANQGYAGGTGADQISETGAGGGGAGAIGGTAGSSTGGTGGNGVTTSISGISVTYAGGGGGRSTSGAGGAGGSGGGGAGEAGSGTPAPGNGVANTGGGGGGANSALPGNGGSGIVIVRYAV